MIPRPFLSHSTAIFFIVSSHLAGFVGLYGGFTKPLFLWLVPFNLCLTAVMLFGQHRDWSWRFVIFSIIASTGGFFLEVAGVYTKIIFGDYQYEGTLGYKAWNVPLTIALNWWTLLYACGTIAERTKFKILPKILLGASLMTFLDLWIEPIAIRFQFWSWQNNVIPIQNYVAWFVASCLLLLPFYLLRFRKNNTIAFWIYGAQLLFFMAHNFIK